jgi:hypothetical protein
MSLSITSTCFGSDHLALVARASIEGWVAIGVPLLGLVLGELLRRLADERKRRKESEGEEGIARSSRSPDRDDDLASGNLQLLESLRHLWVAFRDVIHGVSWVGLVFLVSLSALFWLESLVLRLGLPAGAATGARYVDLAVLIVTGAWLVPGIRSGWRPTRKRIEEASALAVVFLGAVGSFIATGSPVYFVVWAFFGGIAFLKGFP